MSRNIACLYTVFDHMPSQIRMHFALSQMFATVPELGLELDATANCSRKSDNAG